MLGVREVTQVTRAFGEKTVGIGLELVGTFSGNERLRDSGRQLEESANERLRAVEEEAEVGRPSGEGPRAPRRSSACTRTRTSSRTTRRRGPTRPPDAASPSPRRAP